MQKHFRIAGLFAAGLMISPLALAQQEQEKSKQHGQTQEDQAETFSDIETAATHVGKLSMNQAVQRIGMPVLSKDGQQIGEVEDFVLSDRDEIEAMIVKLDDTLAGHGSKAGKSGQEDQSAMRSKSDQKGQMVKIKADQATIRTGYVMLGMNRDKVSDLEEFEKSDDVRLASNQTKQGDKSRQGGSRY